MLLVLSIYLSIYLSMAGGVSVRGVVVSINLIFK